MRTEKLVVLPDSGEAANIQTVTGWVSRTGRFWGNDERMARYDGSTHRYCNCGELIDKNAYCRVCYERNDREKYLAMSSVEWDGKSPLNIHGTDLYFFDEDHLLDHCFDTGCQPKDLPLVVCIPKYAETIEPNEYYSDDLPEDYEVPAEIEEAFRVLNEAIKACKTPLCWYPGNKSVLPESLPTINLE